MPGIIVGIDGSDHSRRALEWAVREAVIHQVPLTVLAVQQAGAGYWSSSVSYPGDRAVTEQAAKMAQAEVDSVLEQADPGPRRPPSVTVRAVTGLPAEGLLHAAEGADLLVVGSRGTGGFSHLHLGSVSTQVTHHAHCPVVITHADPT
jgi:nucleotide-binding universal stress UspA family protein